LTNYSDDYTGPAVIAYENETYKTIGSVCEFGGLHPGGFMGTGGNQAGYMAEMLNFFGINFIWTGVNDQTNEEGSLYISPNPAKDVISIRFDKKEARDGVLKIYDLSGKVMFKQDLNVKSGNNITMDVSNLTSGFYTVEIVTNEKSTTQKLIITK
jgi:hypothetical protein